MDTFIESITIMATEYLGYAPKTLVINTSIEMFRQIRNYPDSYTEDMILSDMQMNKSKIAMAIVELDAKEGAENETSHSENGINRQYSKGITAYVGIPQFAHVM